MISYCLGGCLAGLLAQGGTHLVETWRTERLSTAPGAMLATTSVMDHQGRVIVGGYGLRPSGRGEVAVVRIGQTGHVDWEYRTGEVSSNGVDALAVDGDGGIYVAARLSSLEPWPVALIKLEADGAEAWRYVENDAAAMGSVTGCSVAVDASGNVFFLFARQPGEAWPEPGEYAMAKFRSDGTRWWKCVLPKLTYGFPLGGIWRCLTITPAGDAVVGGMLAPESGEFRGIVAGISAAGELSWFRDLVEDLGHAGSISSVCCNAEGVVCAAGDQGYVLLSATGEVIGRGWTAEAAEVAGAFPDGGFLLTESRGAILTAVNPDGSTRWHAYGRFHGALLPVRNAAEHWLLAGLGEVGFSTELIVQRFDPRGVRSLLGVTSGCRYDVSGDRATSSLLVAPDGTLRLVVNLRPHFWSAPTGLAVVALAIEGVDNAPGIAKLPESATWDGSNEVSFAVTPADPQQSRIQWYWLGTPLAGATNQLLTVSASDLPGQRGYYYAELSDERGAVTTPVAELRIGRVWLEAMPANFSGDYWLAATADVAARFRLETTSDLRRWLAWDGRVYQSGNHGPVTGPELGPVFYRAVMAP